MANLLDYIHWRGDLTLRQNAFNVIDSLILTSLAYLPFDDLITEKPTTLQTIGKKFFEKNYDTRTDILQKWHVDLLKATMIAPRFKKMKWHHYTNQFDKETELQFSATLIDLDYRTTYVAFRGTDMSLIGWKEDFNMTYMPVIPAQAKAREFVQQHVELMKERIWFGGHSKGGNLAMFSAIFAPETIRERITGIHNFDGPGFNQQLDLGDGFTQLQSKITTYVPQSSIIGVLLNLDATRHVIKSKGSNGGIQHDAINWQVNVSDFKMEKITDASSQKFEQTMRQWSNEQSPEDLKQLVNAFFQVLADAKIEYFNMNPNELLSKIPSLIKLFNQMDKKSNEMANQFIQDLFKVIIGR